MDYNARDTDYRQGLDQTLLFEVLVRLAVVDVPFVVFKLLHRLLLEYFVTPLLLEPFRDYRSFESNQNVSSRKANEHSSTHEQVHLQCA